MKVIMEEYGGGLMAIVASLLVWGVNISIFLGPMANTIEYYANYGY